MQSGVNTGLHLAFIVPPLGLQEGNCNPTLGIRRPAGDTSPDCKWVTANILGYGSTQLEVSWVTRICHHLRLGLSDCGAPGTRHDPI